MTPQEVSDQLQELAAGPDFAYQSKRVTSAWISAGVGVEAVEQILIFVERHPRIDYGSPGALVHFVERFYQHGYERALVESIQRQPTPHTVWMLNRVINGTTAPEVRRDYILELERARTHLLLEEDTFEQINHFLDRLKPELQA
jgi:hypothetical protein